MTTTVVPQATIDIDADLLDKLNDAQLGLYMRLVWMCQQTPGSIARIEHEWPRSIKLVQLIELKRLNLIRVTAGLAFSFVSIVQGSVDGAWR